MKKSKLFLFLLLSPFGIFGQTLLTSFDLDLKKAATNHKALIAVNKTNEVFVFGADHEKFTALKYNSAIFFKDSLSTKTPTKNTKIISGFSFDDDNNPIVYWTAEDYKKIQAVSFDFKSKTVTNKEYNFSFKEEILLQHFSENNVFYFITILEKEEKLKLYVFKNNTVTEQLLDFSEFVFLDNKNKKVTLNALLTLYSLEKMETKFLNPLPFCTQKIKFYVLENKLLFTFDHLVSQTQIFEVDLSDFKISEKKILQPALNERTAKTNSFYHEGHVFQLKANADSIIFVIKNYVTTEIVRSFSGTATQDIAFRNSDFLLQTNNKRSTKMKNTKKLLQRLESCELGLSVYKYNGDLLVTIGGTRSIADTAGILLGISVGVGGIISGSDFLLDDFSSSESPQTVYFETHLNKKFDYIKKEQPFLAVDHIGAFLEENDQAVLANVLSFKGYFILGYYDKKAKRFIMRKFED